MLITCSEHVDTTFIRTFKVHDIKIVLVILFIRIYIFICIYTYSCIHHSRSNEECVVGKDDLFKDTLFENIYTDLSKMIK